MLLEFKMENFKSFKNEMSFEMIPAQKITGLEYSLIKRKIVKKERKALAEAIIASILIYKPLTNIVVTQKILLKGEDLCSKKPPSIRAMSPNVTL